MQVRLKPKLHYEIETMDGQQLGVFSVCDSQWQGMIALRSMCGETLIVDAPSWIDRLFGNMESESPDSRTAELVKASPKLLGLIGSSTTPIAKPATAESIV